MSTRPETDAPPAATEAKPAGPADPSLSIAAICVGLASGVLWAGEARKAAGRLSAR